MVREGSTDNFVISTWSKKIRRSHVLKHGTAEDIRNLPDPKPRNRPKPPGIVRQLGPRRKKRKCPRRGHSRQSMIQELVDRTEGTTRRVTIVGSVRERVKGVIL